MSYEKVKAEREADAEIAENAFGWQLYPYPTSLSAAQRRLQSHGMTHVPEGLPVLASNLSHVPRFHTDFDAMGKLIEAMRAKGWRYQICSTESGAGFNAKHVAGFATVSGPQSDQWLSRDGDTIPRAVAKAALAALRQSDK